mmetsp:Transcript_79831/g.205370  ORF Transcript_79831/g.205370 Transcript_79831/m.205370 type:complete len:234 (-) Transcript_79831:1496-2197(-)
MLQLTQVRAEELRDPEQVVKKLRLEGGADEARLLVSLLHQRSPFIDEAQDVPRTSVRNVKDLLAGGLVPAGDGPAEGGAVPVALVEAGNDAGVDRSQHLHDRVVSHRRGALRCQHRVHERHDDGGNSGLMDLLEGRMLERGLEGRILSLRRRPNRARRDQHRGAEGGGQAADVAIGLGAVVDVVREDLPQHQGDHADDRGPRAAEGAKQLHHDVRDDVADHHPLETPQVLLHR